MAAQKPRKLIDLAHPGPSSSPVIQNIAENDWSAFGKHERKDVTKKLAEQPRMNPVNPKTGKDSAGGE